MLKILLTGASGFIGTNLLQDLVSKGYKVLNIDTKSPKDPNHLPYWMNIDILDAPKIEEIVTAFAPDYLVHLAARTDLAGRSLEEYDVNIRGVENILLASSRLPTLKKILITSSMLVCKTGYIPKDPFDYFPTTYYGESKVKTEQLVWANQPTCDWAILRPTSIWGPWFGEPYKHFFDLILTRRYFHIGNRSCTKTYGYVGNSVYQIEKLLFTETSKNANKVFYIGDEPATNIEEWANEIATQLSFKIAKVPFPILKFVALCGDALALLHIKFPMTSFRLRNMTTDNVVSLSNTLELAPNPPYTRQTGISETLSWLKRDSK